MARTDLREGAELSAFRLPSLVESHGVSEHYGEIDPIVSVVISTRGRSEFLAELLDALVSQDMGLDRFEVIVVDDGSKDHTWKVLEEGMDKHPLAMACLRLKHSVGQGAGRNLGVSVTRASLIAFTDDDCVPPPSWLSSLVAPFGSDPGSPRAVVVQGRTTPTEFDRASAGPWARTVWVLRPTWLFETCNIAYRRRDLDAVGGFPGRDEAPHNAAGKALGEDALLGWKVVANGAELVFAGDAEMHHRNHRAGYLEWLLDHRGRAVFPDLAARNPLARKALWHRWFLASRTAAFDAGLLSVLAALLTRRWRFLAGALPWVWMALPEAAQREGKHPVVRLTQIGAGDLLGAVALGKASIEHRTFVG
jgi:glycosyltransferase involved in cell wall biosynthesis